MPPKLNELLIRLVRIGRTYPTSARASAPLLLALTAVLAWPSLHLKWLALMDIAVLSLWSGPLYGWLASAAGIAGALTGALCGLALPFANGEMLCLLGFCIAAVVIATQTQRIVSLNRTAATSKASPDPLNETLFELLPGLAWTLFPDQRVEIINRAAKEFTGNLDTTSPSNYLAALHPDDAWRYFEQLHRTTSPDRPREIEMRLRQYDGQYRWMLCRIHAMLDRHGQLLRWISIGWDIEERKRGEFDLHAQQTAGTRGAGAPPACVCAAHAQDEIACAHQVATSDLGKSAARSIGNGWTDVLPQREWSERVDEQPLDVLLLFRQCDGEYRWRHVTAAPLLDDKGDVINWYMPETDIDGLVKAEEAFKARERHLSQIIETIPVGIWCTAADGQPIWINQRLREFNGLTVEKALDWQWLQFVHPDDRDAIETEFRNAIATGTSYSSMHRLLGLDGTFRWYEQRVQAFRGRDGQIQRWYGVAIDIDERKRADDQRNEIYNILAHASRVATAAELSASIAHELNQPLTSVIANASAGRRWLNRNPPDCAEAMRSFEMILRDGRAADETMQNIRALFKREPVEKNRTRVQDLVTEAVRLIETDPRRKKVPITCSFSDDLPAVLTDRIQIQQVFINLICNGIEAAESIERAPTLRISAMRYQENHALIEVQDNGPGLTDLTKIFDAFVTTKRAGMGIGLAISRSIMQAHGGQLWAENLAEGGACFKIVLPAA